MINLRVVSYEIWRTLATKKYGYILLGLCLLAWYTLHSRIYQGYSGTAPYSALSYSHYLSGLNAFLLPLLILFCIPVFDAKEKAARRILFSSPLTPRVYYLFKTAAIATCFSITASLLVLVGVAFYIWEFRFFAFHTFAFPSLLFLASPAILLLGLSMALGQWTVKSLYGLIPLVWILSIMNLGLPTWVDIAGNNYLLWHAKMSARQALVGGDPVELIHPTLVWSRVGFAAAGLLLLAWVCRPSRRR